MTEKKVWTTAKIIDNYLKRVEGHENIESFSFKEWVPIEEVAGLRAELAEAYELLEMMSWK